MNKSRANNRRKSRLNRQQGVQAPKIIMACPMPRVSKHKNRKNRKSRESSSGFPVGPGNDRLKLGSGVSGSTTRRTQVIEEDEYVAEVSGSTGFVATSYSCNPGQATLFPWGNKIASLYEEYQFEYLEFYYKREVSEFATNGQAGKVMLSFDYDASDSTPTTKQQVEDTVPHVDGMPCTPIIRLPINCVRARGNRNLYVRPGAQPANTDIKMYDIGNLYVSTFGNTNTTNVGELRVRYRVRLYQPILSTFPTAGGVVHFAGTVPTTGNNLATATLQTGGTPSMTGITLGSNTVVFPSGIPGNYAVYIGVQGATSVAAFTSLSAGSGLTALNLITSTTKDATWNLLSAASTTGYGTSAFLTISVAVGGGTLTIGPGTIVGGGIGVDVFIMSLPSSILTLTRDLRLTAELASRVDELETALKSVRFDMSSCSTPYVCAHEDDSLLECKEADLQKSVHISQTMASKLLRAVGGI